MAAHSAAASVPPVPPDQPPEGYATWLREIAAAINLIAAHANNQAALPNAVNDAAAAALGVPVGGNYRAGSQLMVRVAGFLLALLLPFALQAQQVPHPVNGPAASLTGGLACWDSTTGSAVKDCSNIPFPSSFPALTFTGTGSGTTPAPMSDTNSVPLFWLQQTGALLGSGYNTSVTLLEANYRDTGTAAHNDVYVGAAGNCSLLGTRPNMGVAGGALSAACVGVSASASGQAHQGGNLAANQPQGEVHALNIVAIMTAPAADFYDLTGTEIDLSSCPTCTTANRLGLVVVDFTSGSLQGQTRDAAISIGAVSGSAGWRYGIEFLNGGPWPGAPLGAGGVVLGSSGAGVGAVHGIDFHNFVFSGGVIRGPGDAFYVSNAGDVLVHALSATALSTAVGSIAGSVCRAADGQFIYKAAANCF